MARDIALEKFNTSWSTRRTRARKRNLERVNGEVEGNEECGVTKAKRQKYFQKKRMKNCGKCS